MAQKFEELALEKQQMIIDAGLEVFANYPYEKAGTQLIASRAGISKGLLFYYFRNKRDLYYFLYEYVQNKITEAIALLEPQHDLFAYLQAVAELKFALFAKHPELDQFLLRVMAQRELLPLPQQSEHKQLLPVFTLAENEMFAPGWCAEKIIEQLNWLLEGYLQQLRMRNESFELETCQYHYTMWLSQYRQLAIKTRSEVK